MLCWPYARIALKMTILLAHNPMVPVRALKGGYNWKNQLFSVCDRPPVVPLYVDTPHHVRISLRSAKLCATYDALSEARHPGGALGVNGLMNYSHDGRGAGTPEVLKTMARPSARSCLGWSIARVATSITGVRTRIGPRANGSVACRGLSQQGMRSDFCPRMDPLPNTSDPDGICCPRRSTAKRCGTVSRVGPK